MAWLIVLPGIEPLRGATKQLAKTLEAEAPKTEIVYFTRNFQLPTLPYYLAKAGYEVTVLEKNSDSGMACSYANGGVFLYLIKQAAFSSCFKFF